jgi:hypothetical protein
MDIHKNTLPPSHFKTAFKIEIGICFFLFTVFCWMFIHSHEWELEAALFPQMISGLGVLSVLAYLVQISWQHQKGSNQKRGRILDIPWANISDNSQSIKKNAIGIIFWAVSFWLGIWLLGFHIAAPLYLYFQMVLYGGVKKWVAALGGILCLIIIVLVYDELAETTWNDPILIDFVKTLLINL